MVTLSTTAKNAACQAIVDLVNAAAGGGKLIILDASSNTLATFTWTGSVFGTVSGGSATMNSTSSVTAVREGTATQWRLTKSDGTTLVMSGECGQRYKITLQDATNDIVYVSGDRTSVFTARKVVTLVYTSDTAQNIISYVDDEGPAYDSGNNRTAIPIFADVPASPSYNFIHVGMVGFDNADIKEGQTISIGSGKFTILG